MKSNIVKLEDTEVKHLAYGLFSCSGVFLESI